MGQDYRVGREYFLEGGCIVWGVYWETNYTRLIISTFVIIDCCDWLSYYFSKNFFFLLMKHSTQRNSLRS